MSNYRNYYIPLMGMNLLFFGCQNEILNIEDVNTFQGHIVCDENSKSELCIPFDFKGKNYVLDVDSNIYKAFCRTDEKYLARIIKEI